MTKGKFENDKWWCDCPKPLLAKYRTTKNPDSAYAGKSFWRCPKPLDESLGKQCNFLIWEDEAKRIEDAVRQRGAPATRAEVPWPAPLANITPINNANPRSGSIIIPGVAISPPKQGAFTLGKSHNGSNNTSQNPRVPSNADVESERTLEPESSPPSTPRKAIKRENFTTPTRQQSSYDNRSYPSPISGGNIQLPGSQMESHSGKRKADIVDLVSPFSTPTPSRTKDVGGSSTGRGGSLFADITHALKAKNMEVNDGVNAVLRQTCAEHDRRAHKLSAENELLKASLQARDGTINELEVIIKHLRREQAS